MRRAMRDIVPINAQTDDAIPDLLETAPTKKTVRLCGQVHDDKRCMRSKGHDGPHEAIALEGPLSWW